MNENFLQRYSDELLALRKKAARFAEAFPKLAGRLRLTRDIADDPHVERLLQGFAFSAARIRQKIDDSFPELTTELLDTLYPHFLAPLPSTTIVQFRPNQALTTLQKAAALTEIASEDIGGDFCRFRTTQDVDLAPLVIENMTLSGLPLAAPVSPFPGAAGCLTISIRGTSDRIDLRELGLRSLRFHWCAPWQSATRLHEMVCNRALGVAIDGVGHKIQFHDASIIVPGGFKDEEALFPFPENSFSGYRLLSEFFTLPQKFLFFEIKDIELSDARQFNIHIYLTDYDPAMETNVSTADIALHATPVINLFKQPCEPIRVDGSRTEFRLVPDARHQKTREIYSIQSVRVSTGGEQGDRCPHIFSKPSSDEKGMSWQIIRRFNDYDGSGELDVALIEREKQQLGEREMVLSVDTLCTNRNLVDKLPIGGEHPYLTLISNNDSIQSIKALLPFTAQVNRSEHSHREWGLISHLSLNHVSLLDRSGVALKHILHLYCIRPTAETQKLIDSITRVGYRTTTSRLPRGVVFQGMDIEIEFDCSKSEQSSLYLFGTVLDHFLGRFTSINSFTRLTLKARGKPGNIAVFAPRVGSGSLL